MQQSASFETVTKIEAAERQLCAAIRTFFERGDMIAVHTLACASQEIVQQLARPRGVRSIFDYKELIIAEKREEFAMMVREAQNFFKHSGKDQSKTLKFYPDVTKFYLFDAVRLLASLTGKFVPETQTFMGWFLVKFPYLIDTRDMPQAEKARELAKRIDVDDFALFRAVIDDPPKLAV